MKNQCHEEGFQCAWHNDILKDLLPVDDKWIADEYKPYVDTVKFVYFSFLT